MRLYLDTNILIFMWNGELDCIDSDTFALLKGYENILYTSTVCVQELIHLCQIGKISSNNKRVSSPIKAEEVLKWLESTAVNIVSVNKSHLQKYALLPLFDNHRDPNDRLIIAQAISDKISLVSSDRKFEQYKKNGLKMIFNNR